VKHIIKSEINCDKIYLDITQSSTYLSIYVKDTEVIPAGTTVYSMSVKEKNSEYQRFADEYGIHFIFDDNVQKIYFYKIPMVNIFATDNFGGYIGSLGHQIDLEKTFPYVSLIKIRIATLLQITAKIF
jgi:hypothetical protein